MIVADPKSKRTLATATIHATVHYIAFLTHSNEGPFGAGADDILVVVTDSDVLHWSFAVPDSHPEPLFSRSERLQGCQIISYTTSPDRAWHALTGISRSPPPANFTVGTTQLHNAHKNMSQILDAHAATFATWQGQTLLIFANREAKKEGEDDKAGMLRVFDISGVTGTKKHVSIFFPPELPQDVPLAVHVSSRYPTLAWLVTKAGFVQIFDVVDVKCIYANRVADTTPFASVPYEEGGLLILTRRGNVLHVNLNEGNVIDYIRQKLGDSTLAAGVASRNGLTGADQGFGNAFEDAFEERDYEKAALIAADSPRGCLRTADTVERFFEVGPVEAMRYFSACMKKGALNEDETVVLIRVLEKGGKIGLLEKWLKDGKVHCSEPVGDAVRQADATLGMAVYIKCGVHQKVLECMVQRGEVGKVALYAQKVGMKVSHRELVDLVARFDPHAALEVANNSSNALVLVDERREKQRVEDVGKMVDMFMKKGMLNEATSHAMDHLGDETDEEGVVQTKVLKACLMNAPHLADGILSQDIWHRYNAFTVAMLCERQGLFQHALDLYEDLADVKRVITNTHVLNPEFVLNYFAGIQSDDQLEVLEEILKSNPRANITLCVNIAARYTESMGGAKRVLLVFESVPKVPDALYYYLGSIVAFSDVPEVHNRFITVAVELGQYEDAAKVTRESNFYDPEDMKKFLIRARPKDPRPLINVCDRFGYVDELVKYFVKYRQQKYVEGYVQRINPLQTPTVIGALLDSRGMKEADMKKLILSVKNNVPVKELVDNCQSRGKIGILEEFLESRIGDGSTDAAVHTGAAKVYIETNRNPRHFLETNPYYNSKEVGKFCSKRDPLLAFVAYQRGQCDDEVLQVTNDNSLFREQALYAVDRADNVLWGKIFDESNPFRRLVVDQVISTAMPECKRPEKVSAAVKAFLEAGMPDVLMEMLEKIVVQTSNTAFARNANLQNLLILTAIGAAPERVMEYVRRLDNYDGPDIAPSCVDAELYEEAYTIYYKFERFDEALDVLLEHIKDFDRAMEFAIRMDRTDVWLRLGVVQLENGLVADGIRSLIRAKDLSHHALVVDTARHEADSNEDFKMVAKFMRIARKKIRQPESAVRGIDTELVHALCRLNALTDVEEFIITSGHKADLEDVGDRCFDIELYQAAKMMFRAVPVYSKLAHTHIKLKEYKEAVSAARKANRIPTWRIVCFGCVDGLQFSYAAPCALRLLVEMEEMEECVEYYEERGHFQEIIDVLEAGLNLPRAHAAMFTATAVLMTKYREQRVLNFSRMWHGKLNIPKVSRACTKAHLWDSLVFLYVRYNEYENAANVMMDHSPVAFDAGEFLDVISNVGSMNVMYRSIDFYLGEQPELLEDLLNVLAPRIDGSRAVGILQRARRGDFGELGCLPFAVRYLKKIQKADVPEVNEALNAVYISCGDIEALKRSVHEYGNFDQISLAQTLESHALLVFRRISSQLYARNGRHEHAIAMALKDSLYDDMVYAIAQSEDAELAETYASYFAENGLAEVFTALLYACYDFFPPDIALEYVWRGDLRDHSMPFLIQTLKEAGSRLGGLEEERKTRREIEQIREREEEEELVDPSVLLYGLQDAQAPLMIGYHQTGGAPPGGSALGGGVPLIGWGGGQAQADPMAAYATFAYGGYATNAQGSYMTHVGRQ